MPADGRGLGKTGPTPSPPAAEIFLRACAYLKRDVITAPNISLADAIVDGLYERRLA